MFFDLEALLTLPTETLQELWEQYLYFLALSPESFKKEVAGHDQKELEWRLDAVTAILAERKENMK